MKSWYFITTVGLGNEDHGPLFPEHTGLHVVNERVNMVASPFGRPLTVITEERRDGWRGKRPPAKTRAAPEDRLDLLLDQPGYAPGLPPRSPDGTPGPEPEKYAVLRPHVVCHHPHGSQGEDKVRGAGEDP